MSVQLSDLELKMQPTVHRLTELAVKGLVSMFDRKRQLFCFRIKRTTQGLVQEGTSQRYTVISLLGLHRLEAAGRQSPIDIDPILDILCKETSWIDNLGDLGLLLWLCALASPARLEKIYFDLNVAHALKRYREARQKRTMELAWFLAGLSYTVMAHRAEIPYLSDLAVETYRLLKNNQGAKGIFGHLAQNASLAGVIRGRVGSFADQIYPVYALTRFAQAFGIDEALQMALTCARSLCQAQGLLGQWWWHYDSGTGDVAGKYPVYSVHQDGMAPMALFALEEVSGSDFSPWIYQGLEWITGKNELNVDLRDLSDNLIWRSIYCTDFQKYLGEFLRRLGADKLFHFPNFMNIRFECRPYHFGWLLYAFANRTEARSLAMNAGSCTAAALNQVPR